MAKAHGLAGEVVVDLWTDQAQRLEPGSSLASPSGELRVVSSRPMGGSGDRYLVRFESVGDRAAAEALRGTELSAEALEVPGTLWVHELVGSVVRDVAGTELGRVIGRRGRTAQAIRTLVNVAGAKDGVQASVDIVDV